MKAKLYILTYNNEQHLNDGLTSLFTGDLSQHDLKIYIINNHTNFHLHDEFKDRVEVLHNVLQPDFGTGHTSRNWNQGLMHGFRNLNNPDCDLVILAQDDTFYQPNWLNLLNQVHFGMGYDFFCVGAGDMLHSYTPNAVKKIGLWDERYSSICYMEHDYFIRAAMYLGNKASINDKGHMNGLYTINPIPFAFQIADNPPRNESKALLGRLRGRLENPIRELFKAKWGAYSEHLPTSQFINQPRAPNIPCYVIYPYFEEHIEGLVEKGYNLLSGGWTPPGYVPVR